MRVILAAIVGGIVVFFWGFLSHAVLPIGEIGMRVSTDEDAVIAALKANLPEEGVYYVPYLDHETMRDEAKNQAWGEKSAANPNAFIAYQPVGRNSAQMGTMLITEGVTNVLSALIAAMIAWLAGSGFAARVMVVAGMGLFSFVTIHIPMWNWYRFPLEFTQGQGIVHIVGWILAGIAIALVLPRR
jgi:hypothetical protein